MGDPLIEVWHGDTVVLAPDPTQRRLLRTRGIRQLTHPITTVSGQVYGRDHQHRMYWVGQTMATVKPANDDAEFYEWHNQLTDPEDDEQDEDDDGSF